MTQREEGFYWVKFSADSKWEVARWDSSNKGWKFTSGGRSEFCLEIDERRIERLDPLS